MKEIIKTICILITIPLIFNSCGEEENTPADPADPVNPASYVISDCDTMNVSIIFSGTQFMNSSNGNTFTIDGTQDWNNTCHQYFDEAQMILDGVNYIDIVTSTLIPTEYGSTAELDYGYSSPMLKIHLTNNEGEMSGMNIPDSYHLNIDFEDIQNQPLNTPIIINGGMFDNMLYDNWFDAVYTVTFTNIDITNRVFEGSMGIQFSPRYLGEDFNGNPMYDDYLPQINTTFSANVSYFKFTVEI